MNTQKTPKLLQAGDKVTRSWGVEPQVWQVIAVDLKYSKSMALVEFRDLGGNVFTIAYGKNTKFFLAN